MNWTLIYSQFLLPTNGAFPAQLLPGISSAQLTFLCTSPDTAITWRRACRATMLLPGPGGADSQVAARRRIPLGLEIKVDFPVIEDVSAYSLRLDVAPWHPNMLIQIWSEAGNSEPPPDNAVMGMRRDLFVVSVAGQSQFQLSRTVARPEMSELFINGIKATYGTEYQADGSALTWLTTPELEITDEVEFIYFS